MPALKSVEEKYGNILFADQRFKKSPETNTITENKVYKKIMVLYTMSLAQT